MSKQSDLVSVARDAGTDGYVNIAGDTMTGALTATSFSGDGGSLTNVGQVIKCSRVYSSNAFSSGGTKRQLSGIDWYFYDNNLVGGSFTKDRSDTSLVVQGWISDYNVSGNTHDSYVWIGTDATGSNTSRYHLGLDGNRMTGNRYNFTFTAFFNGINSGTHYALAAAGRGDANTWNSVLNYNTTSYVSTDTANENTRSSLLVWEVL